MRLSLASLATVALLVGTQQAAALSCAPADPFAALAKVNTSPLPYAVVYGDFVATGPKTDKGAVPMTFNGIMMSDEDIPVAWDILATSSCPDGVCTATERFDDAIAYVQMTDAGPFLLELAACNTHIYPGAESALVDSMRTEVLGIMGFDE